MTENATPAHRDAEQRMRELVRDAALPEPDEVRYEFDPNEVVLMWNEQKLAVVIDLEDDGMGESELRDANGRHTTAGESAEAPG